MKNGLKVLRKVKGVWVAVAMTGLIATVTLPASVQAVEVNNIQVEQVLASKLGSTFDGKEDLVEDTLIQTESKKALEAVTPEWEENKVEDIKAEIERQEELGLKAYVVQWGDTMSLIGEALELNDEELQDLIELNQVEDRNFILTGDILDGVLKVDESAGSTETNNESKPETPEVPETPETPEVPETPETPTKPAKPETPEVPETPETPEVPETPETPAKPTKPAKPETPEVPETPETPEVPETPGEEIPSEIPVETPEVPENEAPTEEEVPAETEVIGEEVIEEEGESWQEEVPGEGGGLVNEETNTEEQLIPGEPTIIYEEKVEIEIVIVEVPQYDEEGNPILDENGNQVVELVEHEVEIPVITETIVPGEDITQSTTTTKRFYVEPFKTIINYDGTVLSGDDIVEQEGINGEYVEITTVITEDGVVISGSTDTQVISNMIPRIIRRGTKTQQTVRTIQETYVINHGVEYVTDDGVPTGEKEVVQEGVNGQRVVTIEEVLDANGAIVSRTVISEDVTEAINKVIKVGTQVTEVRHYGIDETIDFTTEYVNDDTLPVGETEVVQTGQKGTAVRTFEVTYVNGVETNRVETGYVVTSNPVNEVIARGTQTTEVKQVTEDKTIEFETEYRTNPNLPKGEEREVQAGVNGTERTTYNVTYVNGDEVDREVVGTEVVKAPVNRIVEVGAQVTETKTETKTESVEFKTEYRPNPNLPKGEEKLVQAGVDGTRTIKYEVTYVNGKETSRKEVSNTVTKAPVNRIVEVGTKEDPVSDDLIIEYKQGDKIGDYTLTQDVSFNVSDIVNESDAAKHQKAQTGGNLHTTTGKSASGQNWRIGIRMSEEVVDAFNDGTIFNHSIFNDRMLELVNELRQSVGSSVLEHAEVELQGAADIRAQEMADYGSLRFEGQPHTRPDGTKWTTALPEDRKYGAGENIAQRSHHTNFYETLSETALAEAFFNQWKASPGHYTNMINSGHTGFATSVRIGTGVTPAQGDSVFNHLIAVQIFKNR